MKFFSNLKTATDLALFLSADVSVTPELCEPRVRHPPKYLRHMSEGCWILDFPMVETAAVASCSSLRPLVAVCGDSRISEPYSAMVG